MGGVLGTAGGGGARWGAGDGKRGEWLRKVGVGGLPWRSACGHNQRGRYRDGGTTMKIRVLVGLLLVTLVAGCNKGVDMTPAMTAWQGMAATVTSFEQMNFTSVQVPATVSETFAVGDPIFDFGGDGTSYFRAYALPETSSPYVLEVTSDRVQYSCAPCTMGTLMPDVLLLDTDKKPIRKIALSEQIVSQAGDKLRRHVWATVPPETGARYAVVYTARASVGRKETGFVKGGGGVAYAAGIFFPLPSGPYYSSTGMPIGPMRFVLREPGSEGN